MSACVPAYSLPAGSIKRALCRRTVGPRGGRLVLRFRSGPPAEASGRDRFFAAGIRPDRRCTPDRNLTDPLGAYVFARGGPYCGEQDKLCGDLVNWMPHGDRRDLAVPRTLVVTGHFPPDHGGVQRFTSEIVRRLPADQVVVAAIGRSPADASGEWCGHAVHRLDGPWFTNPRLAGEVSRLAQRYECEAAWVTSAMPLGALAPVLRRGGVERVTVSTHGMEVGWSRVPPARTAMRALSRSIDAVTYLGDFTRPHIARAVAPGVELHRLHGGVDVNRFRPRPAVGDVRSALGLQDRRVVVSVARLVPRKGQDVLIRAWPSVLRRHPDAVLVVVGEGGYRRTLERLAAEAGVARQVRFTGEVSDELLVDHLAAAEVFALPCRTVWHGLQPEGLGLSTLEASASGLPVVVGDSGGAPEAVLDGRTGIVVDGGRVPEVADALCVLLDDPHLARDLGSAGRHWVQQHWTWEQMTARLVGTLTDPLAQAA